MRSVFLVGFILFGSCLDIVAQRSLVPSEYISKGIVLSDVNGLKISIDNLMNKKATVFYMLSPDCPLCQSYSLTINNFDAKYADQGLTSVGIFPGKLYSKNEIREFVSKYRISMILLLDPDYIITKELRASVTPEAFLVDRNRQVKYSGRIDNWAYSIGRKRPQVTEFNLRDAITELLKGHDIPVTRTRAVGCIIE